MAVANIGKFVYSVVVNNSVSTEMGKIDTKAGKAGKTIDSLGNKVKSLQSGIVGFGVASVAAFAGFNSVMNSGSVFANNISSIATKTGIATDSLQGLSNAYSNVASVSLDKAQGDLAGLATQINEIKGGLRGSENFLRIGVGINKQSNVENVIADLRTKLAGQSDVKASLMLSQIGLDEGFLKLLRASGDEMQKLNRIPILTQQQIQNTIKAGKAMDAVKKQIVGLKNVAVATIAPIVTTEFNKFFNLIDSNKDRIIDFFTNTINFAKNFAIAIGNTIGLLSDFIGWLGNTANGMEYLAIGIGAVMLAFRPMLFAFSGLVLLADDFAVWQRGGEAAFGSIYSWIEKYSEIITPFAKTIAGAFAISFGTNQLIKMATFFSGTLTLLKTFASAAMLLLNPVVLGIAAVAGIGYLGKKAYDKYIGEKENENTTASDSNWVQSLFPNSNNTANEGKMTFASPTSTSSQISNNSEITNNFNITGDNPQELANKIKDILEEQNRMKNNSMSFSY